ncbi:ribonuclease H-like domain-containing protein [Tanacetum coccineum]
MDASRSSKTLPLVLIFTLHYLAIIGSHFLAVRSNWSTRIAKLVLAFCGLTIVDQGLTFDDLLLETSGSYALYPFPCPYGKLSRYKARLVANGSTQLEGVDVDETFSPVVKPDTIRNVLSLAPLLQQIIALLHQEFSRTHLGSLNYFLGISVTRDSFRMFLSQKKYDVEILERAYMSNCNPSRTPVDTESKLGDDGDPVSDPTLYRSLAGSLQYVRGTLDYELQLFSSSTTSLVAYSDADWASFPTNRRSTSGYLQRQSIMVLPMLLLRRHQRTNHIEIDIHFVRDLVAAGHVRVLHVPSRYQYADIFTKGLPSALFEKFCTSLSV